MLHLLNGILHSRENKGNPTFHDSKDGSREHCAKLNKPVRKRQMPYDLTYMWNLVNKINKIETDSDTEKSLTAVRGEGLEGGMK